MQIHNSVVYRWYQNSTFAVPRGHPPPNSTKNTDMDIVLGVGFIIWKGDVEALRNIVGELIG